MIENRVTNDKRILPHFLLILGTDGEFDAESYNWIIVNTATAKQVDVRYYTTPENHPCTVNYIGLPDFVTVTITSSKDDPNNISTLLSVPNSTEYVGEYPDINLILTSETGDTVSSIFHFRVENSATSKTTDYQCII